MIPPTAKSASLANSGCRSVASQKKYCIGALQDLARERAVNLMSKWDTIVFAETMKEIFTCTSDFAGGTALRTAAMSTVVHNVSKLFQRDCTDAKYGPMREMLEKIPDFRTPIITEQNALIQNLECVSQVLNNDSGKLILNARFPRAPNGTLAVAGSSPVKCYQCPNCTTIREEHEL